MKMCKALIISVISMGLLITSQYFNFHSIFAQEIVPKAEINTSGMSLTIAADRKDYLRSEPIKIMCKFSNETMENQTAYAPHFASESSIIVEQESESKQFNSISPYRILLGLVPATFKPGDEITEEINLQTNLDDFFPKAGVYKIRLLLPQAKVSNFIELRIVEPTGANKDAFDFIQSHKNDSPYNSLFDWREYPKLSNGRSLLEEFVSKYGESAYGDSAALKLGITYFVKNELEKAKPLLEKAMHSNNSRIAKDAALTLEKVQKNNVVMN